MVFFRHIRFAIFKLLMVLPLERPCIAAAESRSSLRKLRVYFPEI